PSPLHTWRPPRPPRTRRAPDPEVGEDVAVVTTSSTPGSVRAGTDAVVAASEGCHRTAVRPPSPVRPIGRLAEEHHVRSERPAIEPPARPARGRPARGARAGSAACWYAGAPATGPSGRAVGPGRAAAGP